MIDDIGFALEAKSDQLNAIDIMGVEPVIKIREVKIPKGDQPVWIYFDGDNNRPWKPSKGMLRIIAGAWGRGSPQWVGKQVQIFCEPSVTWGGKEVGGIQIRAMSDIPEEGLTLMLTISRSKREPYFVAFLKVEAKTYPAEEFTKNLPLMAEWMKEGKMSLQQVIARCQKTGTLSEAQLKSLESHAPVDDENPKNETAKPEQAKSIEEQTAEILANENE